MTDKETNEFVTGLSPWPNQPIWIGAYRSSWDRKQWLWNDGTPWSWTDWRPREPNDNRGKESCVWIYKKKWNDVPCSMRKNVVCQQSSIGKDRIMELVHFTQSIYE